MSKTDIAGKHRSIGGERFNKVMDFFLFGTVFGVENLQGLVTGTQPLWEYPKDKWAKILDRGPTGDTNTCLSSIVRKYHLDLRETKSKN